MPQLSLHARLRRSAFFGYALAIVSISAVTGLMLSLRHFNLPHPFSACALAAIALTYWYSGMKPGIFAVLLATVTLNYVFEPQQAPASRIIYAFVYVPFALLIGWLTRVRDDLEVAVAERTRNLTQEKAHLDELFELAPEAIVLVDANGWITRVNKEFTRIFGYSAAEAQGHSVADLTVPPEFRSEFENQLSMLAAGQTVYAEGVRRRKDGSKLSVHIAAAPIVTDVGPIGAYVIYRDITDRKAAEKALNAAYELLSRELEERVQAQEEIRALTERLMKAQEEERMRIAGELHDGILQQLTSLTLQLGAVKRKVPRDSEATADIRDLQQKLMQAGTEIRHLSHELHPALLQEAGLPAALSSYCEEFSKVRGIPISYDADESVADLSPGAALCLYRIAQEALGNIAKHARATHAEVQLTRSNCRVCLSVSDDGVGFGPNRSEKSGGLGLINIRERVHQLNGTFDFDTEPGRGTTVRVAVPLPTAS